MKKLLHVGCSTLTKKDTIPYFFSDDWQEIRFDIDSRVNPDVVGTLTDMSALDSESVDAIYSSHNLEHLYDHEVDLALLEFRRVLKEDGFLVITCPDLHSISRLIVDGKLREPAYISPSGLAVSPHDMLYGWGSSLKEGNFFMAHRSGFDSPSMHEKLMKAQYHDWATFVSEPNFALWVVARKETSSKVDIENFSLLVLNGCA